MASPGNVFVCLMVFSGIACSLRLTGPPERLVQGLNQTTGSARDSSALAGNATAAVNVSALDGNATEALNVSALVANATAVCADPDILGAFRMAPHWGHYALNDLLFENGDTFGKNGTRDAPSFACGNESFPGAWPDSLYCKYRKKYHRTSSFKNTTKRLFKLLKKKIAKKQKNPGVVMHVRMGDVIDNSSSPVTDMLAKQIYYYPHENRTWNRYVMPLAHYRNIAHQLAPGEHVTLVGSPHQPDYATWTHSFNKSCVYTFAVAAYLQDLGLRVHVRVGRAPDDDLVFMVNSSRFALSGGQYSVLIGRLVELNGGEVIVTPALSMMQSVIDAKVAGMVELERE